MRDINVIEPGEVVRMYLNEEQTRYIDLSTYKDSKDWVINSKDETVMSTQGKIKIKLNSRSSITIENVLK